MGLYVNSVSQLPLSESREYYLYVLDYYNWNEPVGETLRANMQRIAQACATSDAVMIAGLPSSHFESDVLSWLTINGEPPGNVLPALLITTIHPRYFIDGHHAHDVAEKSDALILVKIREICKTPQEVVSLIERVLADIATKKKIDKFQVSREVHRGVGRAIVDALVLEPNFNGLGLDLRKLVNWFRGR